MKVCRVRFLRACFHDLATIAYPAFFKGLLVSNVELDLSIFFLFFLEYGGRLSKDIKLSQGSEGKRIFAEEDEEIKDTRTTKLMVR